MMHNPATGDICFQLCAPYAALFYTATAPYYLKTKAHVQQYRHRSAPEPKTQIPFI
jgi:hypothetical protein